MAFDVNQPNIQDMQNYLSKEKERNTARGDGPRWWNIPAGMSSIRILPPWDPTGRVALPVFMHPIEYQEKDMKYKKYNWTCVHETFGKPCKICEGLEELRNAGVDTSKYEAGRRQFYMNAIIMHDPVYQADLQSGKKPEDCGGVAPGTHVLMKAPKTLYDWVISQITNPMVGDITSITNGIDIYLTKDGTGLGTTYTPTLSPNGRTAIPQEYLDKIESLYNLDEIFSTGFDEELIGRLVSHLKTSAGILANNIPGVVSNMAGYPTPQPNMAPTPPVPPTMHGTTGYPPVNNFTAAPPSVAPQGAPIAPTPYNQGVPVAPSAPPVPPVPPVTSAPPSTAPASDGVPPWTAPSVPYSTPQTEAPVDPGMPKCFGNYDPTNVTCVVCPQEIPCSQSKGK